MAFSESVKLSQDILICGLCDVNDKVRVKCMDCDLYLCEECEERHSKFKHADLHSVLAIRDIYLHKDEEEEFKPVKCKNHKKQFCSIFCRTCDHLICPICIVETHQKHDLEKIEMMCKKKYDELKNLENDANRKTQIYLQELCEDQKSEYTKIEEILKAKIKVVKELHTRHAKQLREIKHIKKKLAHDISQTEDVISKEQEAIQKERAEMEELLKSKNTEKIIEVASNLQTRLKTFSKTMTSNEQKLGTLTSISGDYTSAVATFTVTKIEFTKLKSFLLENISVYSITSNQKIQCILSQAIRKILYG